MDAEQQALVFDNGSFMIKVGFAGSNEPLLVPPVVSLSYFSQTAGEEAVRKTPYYLKYTIGDDGDIKDGKDVKKVHFVLDIIRN
jgi:actin-related protein